MQETICAKVNARLLSKADRLFTGTVEGRIIEILQNARRAGATEVRISNKKGLVTVEDNGSGIEDFQKLLDLGGSGWDERIEAGEDPAGVGLFSLAPREVTIASGRRQIVIEKDGWTGAPVKVSKISSEVQGTLIKFQDDKPWSFELVEKYAVFTGLKVCVDGKECYSLPFCRDEAKSYVDPGCWIEVTQDISDYHRLWSTGWHYDRVLVNFHGQVVQLEYFPGRNYHGLHILVDIADQTDLRLMLPARTRLVENQVFEQLKAALEVAYYRYFQKVQIHSLYYQEYLRAEELGIALTEAQPQYKVGLLEDDYDLPIEVSPPPDFKLADGYLCANDECDDDLAETNAHLLAALGQFVEKPFVPVTIDSKHLGYSWTKLPKVTSVKVEIGKELLRQFLLGGEIACFDKLAITVQTSDGNTFRSGVALAIRTETLPGPHRWSEELVCVTQDARTQLSTENIWFHLGGYHDEDDSYDTQLSYFEKELEAFWNELIGPYETLRHQIIEELYSLEAWQKVTIFADSSLEIVFKDGRKARVKPPAPSA